MGAALAATLTGRHVQMERGSMNTNRNRYVATAHETGWGVVDAGASDLATDKNRFDGRGMAWVTQGDWSREAAERMAARWNRGGES